MSYIMALDQGTTSSRCILFDHDGKIVSSSQREFEQFYPHPGWVEHDPDDIWESLYAVMAGTIRKADASARDIAGIGITNQRETTIVWNKNTGRPVYNAIVWQCRRTAKRIEELKETGVADEIREKTGLILDPYFSASKIEWILDNVFGARRAAENGELLFGTVDTYIIWKLTGGKVHVTDYTNASRTMLFDIRKLCWDDELLSLFNIPKSMMPDVKPSSCIYGYTDQALIGAEIPICSAVGDQQAALFGQCCFEKGDVKNTYGTGGFLLMNTGSEAVTSRHGLITTIAASENEDVQYALEGSVFISGAAVQWLRDEMELVKSSAESEDLALKVMDTAGVYVVPAFTGMGAPYWDPDARGTIVGVTRGCSRAHFARAVLESIAYQSNDVISAMEEDLGSPLSSIRVDGGACANNFLMQFQADITDTEVLCPECLETTALGAAYLAGLAAGYWKDKEEIKGNWRLDRQFRPGMRPYEREALLAGWEKAVKTAIYYSQLE